MKALILISLAMFSFNVLIAQERAIRITHTKNEKETIIKELKRIRIKTVAGERISGRYTIVDKKTIEVKDRVIPISEIEKIKRNPLLFSIVTNGFLYDGGAVIAGISLVAFALTGEAAVFLFTIPAGMLIYGGIKSPNVLKGFS